MYKWLCLVLLSTVFEVPKYYSDLSVRVHMPAAPVPIWLTGSHRAYFQECDWSSASLLFPRLCRAESRWTRPSSQCSPWCWPLLNKGHSLSATLGGRRWWDCPASDRGVCLCIHYVGMHTCRMAKSVLVSVVCSPAKVKVMTHILIGILSNIHHSTPLPHSPYDLWPLNTYLI